MQVTDFVEIGDDLNTLYCLKHCLQNYKMNDAVCSLYQCKHVYFSALEQLGSQSLNSKLRSQLMSTIQYWILPSKVLFLARSASRTSGLWGGGGLWRWYSSPGGAGGAPWCTAAHISAAPHHPEYPSILSLEVSSGILSVLVPLRSQLTTTVFPVLVVLLGICSSPECLKSPYVHCH